MSTDRTPGTTVVGLPGTRTHVLLRNQKYLRDAAGRVIANGERVQGLSQAGR